MVRRYRKSDFSLIEVLVALTIIAVSFSVYMRALSLNIKNTGVAKSYITACLLAKKKLTKLALDNKKTNKNDKSKSKNEDENEDKDVTKNEAKEGDFGIDYPGFSWQLKTKKQSKYIISNELIIAFIRNGETRELSFHTLSVDKKELKKKSTDKNKSKKQVPNPDAGKKTS